MSALVSYVTWTVAAFTIAFALASLPAGMIFFRRARRDAPESWPPVTILKPLKGDERELASCLESFCRLDYPRYQLVLTLASPEDSALPVATRLREAYPALDLEIVVSKHRVGYNPKINNVANAEPFIKHGLLLLSDSDIRVERDFLKRMVLPLSDARVGLVTAFYRSGVPGGMWAALEALAVNAHFLPQTLLAAACGRRFALGAAMLARREAFDAAGGFAAMSRHLADDYALGEGVLSSGRALVFADLAVESVPDASGAREHLRRQARCARTIRACDPRGYAGMVLLHGFSLLTLKLAVFGAEPVGLALLAGVFASKALSMTGLAALLNAPQSGLALALLPASEWLAFGAWVSGFFSTTVLWRGHTYRAELLATADRG